jgi:hypothetical protein
MKRQFFALSVFVLALGALATQSCESTGGQNSYYNRGHYGYYRDGGYARENGYYHDSSYAGDDRYYHQRRYARDDYQSDRPAIDVHFLEQLPFISGRQTNYRHI